jgi:uncharacterized protein YdbL (DUF1318 family)
MMTPLKILIAGLSLIGAGAALAQGVGLAAAISAGQVGEQADGYVGAAKPIPPDIKAQVDALNIKRRAAYTDEAARHGVALRDWAVTIGCQTLRRVKPGEAYLLPDGVWRTKGTEPIALPPVCG